MAQNITGFMFQRNKFPRISDAKIKEEVYFGPQKRELIEDAKFEDQLSELGNAAWTPFKNITTNFLGDGKQENYRDAVADFVQSYKANGM